MSFSIHLDKENFKFSCSHFTILDKDRAERLHGHNYYISASIELSGIDSQLGMGFDFNLVKPLIREIADSIDEFVLIPLQSPFLKVERTKERVKVTFHEKFYDFPSEDVRLLPVANITSEELARYIATELHKRMKAMPALISRVKNLGISIQETRGQTVNYRIDF
jgi:6-pyruvoyltetrahydropterin/6-carboxytetrahydropterin synthase